MDKEAYTENLNRIKKFPILEYANIIGLTPVRKGRYFSLSEYDSVIIDPEKNCFFRNSNGVKGSIIDFSMEFEGKDYKDVIKYLTSLAGGVTYEIRSYTPKTRKKETEKLTLPKKDSTYKNVYAYLIKSRGIEKDVVDYFVGNNMLYQDENKNAVFVGYDDNGKPNFANKRGTNTKIRFMAEIPGSDYSKCFYINNNADMLVVTESVIDAMSVMSFMQMQGVDYKNYNYCALAGVSKYGAVKNHIKKGNINQVLLAVDNDTAGIECIDNIKKDLISIGFKGKITDNRPNHSKDWNEELLKFQSINFNFTNQNEMEV